MITKEMVEAAMDAYREGAYLTDDQARASVTTILTAAFAAMPGPAVKVHDLVWVDARFSDRWFRYTADTIIGRYEALQWSTGDFGFTCPSHDRDEPNVEHGGLTSIIAAKAAAQADYEVRILSALTPAPDLQAENERLPQDVINLVIAAREFWEIAMDESDESAALDCALEAFSSRVPYENDPEEERAALERP